MELELVSQIRNRIAWWRSKGRDDERLYGAWVPDPSDENFPYVSSRVIADGKAWSVIRLPDGRHDRSAEYRTTEDGRLLTRNEGTVSSEAYRFDDDGNLVLGGIRRLRAIDPDAREWPPGVDSASKRREL